MVSKVLIIAMCLVVAVMAVPPQAGGAVGVGGPPAWLASAPWMPKWTACDPLAGNTCVDCTTRVICTKVGGLVRPCSGTLPHCDLGQCVATPNAACAAAPVTA